MDVLVVGGGIVGCAVAAACARRGLGVVLVERGALASAASGLDLALLGLPGPAVLQPLAARGEELYLELHHFTGRAFFLDRTPIECDGGRGALVRRIDPRGAVLALAEEARSYRAEVRTGCDVKGLLVRGGGEVAGARTDAGELRAATTVAAAGAETWRVCRGLAGSIPLQTAEAVTGVYPPGGLRHERPRFAHGAWAALDEAGRAVVAEPERLASALPELHGLEPLERRSLRYDDTADGLPLVGPLPGVEGLVLACGHGLHGVALAPAAGEVIAQALAGGGWVPELLPGRLL